MAATERLRAPGILDADEWLARSKAAVLAEIEGVLSLEAASAAQASLLSRALTELSARTTGGGIIACVHLPLLAHVAFGGRTKAAVPLAAATTIIEAAAILLDHALDGELAEPWAHQPEAAIMAAALGGGPIARRALARAPARPQRRLAVQDELDRGLLKIAAGQLQDLELRRQEEPPELDALIAAAAGKTGGRRRLQVRLGAVLAGAAPDRHPLVGFADALGTARQLASDLADLNGRRPSRDLTAETWTWPLAWHARQLAGVAQAQFAIRRHEAANDPDVAAAIAEEVRGGGALLRTTLEIRRHCMLARRCLAESSTSPVVAELLDRLVSVMEP